MIGKIVDVFFSNAPALYGVKVLSSPQAEGDSWSFQSKDGKEHRAMHFERMSEIDSFQF